MLGVPQIAEVQLWEAQGAGPAALLTVQVAGTHSDAEGHFQLDRSLDLEGVYALLVRPAERAMAGERGIVGSRPDTWDREIRVRGGVGVSGVVQGPTGEPLAGAQVGLFAQEESSFGVAAAERTAVTGQDGRFELLAASPGRKRLRFQAEGHIEAHLNPLTVPESVPVTGLVMRLQVGQSLTGIVRVRQTSRALAGRRVELRSTFLPPIAPTHVTAQSGGRIQPSRGPAEVGLRLSSYTNEAGQFTFCGVPAGRLQLTVFDRGGHPQHSAGVDPQAGPLEVWVPAQASIRGRVVDSDGRGLTNFHIALVRDPSHAQAFSQSAVVGTAGDYEVVVRDPGRWFVLAKAPGFAPTISPALELGQDESRSGVDLVLNRAASVLGRVLHQGEPLSGATVQLFEVSESAGSAEAGPKTRPLGRLRGRATTESDGSFLIPTGGSGRFQLEIQHPSSVPWVSEHRELGSGDLVLWGDISVEAAATLQGLVRDALGNPDAQAIVAAIPDDAEASRQVAPTDHEGRFRIESLRPGSWRLLVIQSRGLLRTETENRGMEHRLSLRSGEARVVELRLDR